MKNRIIFIGTAILSLILLACIACYVVMPRYFPQFIHDYLDSRALLELAYLNAKDHKIQQKIFTKLIKEHQDEALKQSMLKVLNDANDTKTVRAINVLYYYNEETVSAAFSKLILDDQRSEASRFAAFRVIAEHGKVGEKERRFLFDAPIGNDHWWTSYIVTEAIRKTCTEEESQAFQKRIRALPKTEKSNMLGALVLATYPAEIATFQDYLERTYVPGMSDHEARAFFLNRLCNNNILALMPLVEHEHEQIKFLCAKHCVDHANLHDPEELNFALNLYQQYPKTNLMFRAAKEDIYDAKIAEILLANKNRKGGSGNAAGTTYYARVFAKTSFSTEQEKAVIAWWETIGNVAGRYLILSGLIQSNDAEHKKLLAEQCVRHEELMDLLQYRASVLPGTEEQCLRKLKPLQFKFMRNYHEYRLLSRLRLFKYASHFTGDSRALAETYLIIQLADNEKRRHQRGKVPTGLQSPYADEILSAWYGEKAAVLKSVLEQAIRYLENPQEAENTVKQLMKDDFVSQTVSHWFNLLNAFEKHADYGCRDFKNLLQSAID